MGFGSVWTTAIEMHSAHNINSIRNNNSDTMHDCLQSALTTTASIHISRRPNYTECSRVTTDDQQHPGVETETARGNAHWNAVTLFVCSFGLEMKSSRKTRAETIDHLKMIVGMYENVFQFISWFIYTSSKA